LNTLFTSEVTANLHIFIYQFITRGLVCLTQKVFFCISY